MKTEYESNYTISYTEVNQELELGLTNTIGIVQSIATDYFTSFGSDNKTVKDKSNASYVRFISNLLSCDFLDKDQITDFEIHYLSETTEGQILKIYKKERTQEMEILIKENNREIIRAILKYKLKNS